MTEKIREKEIEDTPDFEANYDGDWTQLLKERVTHPYSLSLLEREVGFSIEDFSSQVDRVFNETNVGRANDFQRKPEHVGLGSFYSPGVVFSDAIDKHSSKPLTIRQKNIAEAHEKLHGLFNDLSDDEREKIKKCFVFDDSNSLNGYPSDVVELEILARMSQLKNYFGFDATKKFTKEHLYYAKKNYVRNIGWDNNMTDFFNAIPKEKEDDFVALMNEVVC